MSRYRIQRKESFSGLGFVEIRPFDIVDGERIYRNDEFAKYNLIVNKGRELLLETWVGLSNHKLKYLRWGKGGALSFPDGDPLLPLEVNDEDLNVNVVLLDKQLSTPAKESATVVSFTETLISDEVDDVVNEAAMMSENQDTMERNIFARITFPTINLSADRGFGIEIKWTFNFAKARNPDAGA